MCIYIIFIGFSIHFHTYQNRFWGALGPWSLRQAGKKGWTGEWQEDGGWWGAISLEINGLSEGCAIHPGRLTWSIIMEVWKIMFLSKWLICRFHVNLPGCTSVFHFFLKLGLEAWNVNTLNESGAALGPLILIGNSNSADVGKATVFPCDLKSLLGMMRDMLRGRWTQSVQVLAPPGLFPFETGSHPSVCYRYCCWWSMQFYTTSKLLFFFKTEAISHGVPKKNTCNSSAC